MMEHETFKEMLVIRAVSALDAADDRALNEHLISCADCRSELDQWHSTTASLSFTTDPMEPTPELRERILAQVRDERSEASRPNVVPFVPPSKNFWTSFGSLGAIAAVLVFAAMIVYLFLLWQENRATRAQIAVLSAEINRVRQDLDFKTQALQLITSPGAKMSELAATPMAPGASAKLAFDKNGHAMLMAQGLPAPDADKEYQLWFIVDGKKLPGKSFTTNSAGSGMLVDQVPPDAMNSAVFAVTLEPKGGVDVPTGQIYLVSRS